MTDPWGNPLPDGVELHPAPGESPNPAPPSNPAWPGRSSTPSPPTPPQPPAPPTAAPAPSAPSAPSGWPAPPPPPGQWPAPNGAPQQRTSGMAIASLVVGIIGLLCTGILLSPTAFVLGLVARRSIARSNGAMKGAGLATAGIVLGIVGTVFALIAIVYLIKNPDALDNLFTTTTTTTAPRGLKGA